MSNGRWPGERIMRVIADGERPFVAAAVWLRIGGAWKCVLTAPILKWMYGTTAEAAKKGLKKRGLRYEWLRGQDLNLRP